ncbi:MAG TPA: MATE family efflux transporter, partial [Candidatus Izemoplasmatales bacterium]|nr:MATE family efflux transporter [Candidatus Izemoplasmatales bacterium]
MNKTKEIKTEMILHQEPLWKGLLKLSVPIFFVNILKTLHDLVDGFFLGQLPDVNGVSVSTQMQTAVGLTWSVFFIFISFGAGLSVAGNALIGQCVGKGDQNGARRYAANTILISLILGLLFNAVLYVFTPLIMRAMGAEGAELQYAITYLRIRSFELPF